MTAPDRPRHARQSVIVISSHVVRGSVGNRAIVFALETMGHGIWAVPTVVLPWHPGHGRGTRIVPAAEDFAALMRDLEYAPWLGEVSAVLSGYLGDPSQADAVAGLVNRLKEENPEALYLCDPVMGEENGLYVPQATACAIRDKLMPLADIATPNRYELAWMAGKELATLDDVRQAAESVPPETMLVTSAPAEVPGDTANLLLTPRSAFLAQHRAIEDPCKGPGDLTSALFLSWLLDGAVPRHALQRATAAVFDILALAAASGADELMLERDAEVFHNPATTVSVRDL
ncbi:pyridoxal kinase PdxY [Chelativorans sp. YIM 93263]|uniref:pyridoxal kinase PdxY n=1 Tax=Chelativorans sp. YIM 93263 TaxID=2906648 RepID=UPI002379851C|nr:pyridoxal kinase PdxY [Chelativorans sp. YIM 93263]